METQQSRKGGGVKQLDPDKGKTTRNEIVSWITIMGTSNITPEPRAKAIQKENAVQGKKID